MASAKVNAYTSRANGRRRAWSSARRRTTISTNPRQREGSEQAELDPVDSPRDVWGVRDGQQAVGVPEHHPDHLEADGSQVGRGDEGPFEPSLQLAGRECEQQMKEERHQDDVEQLSDGEERLVLRERQRGKERDGAGQHHQRTEAALRPAPPPDKSRRGVGQDDPDVENPLGGGALDLARQHQCEGRGCRSTCAERDGDQQYRPGSHRNVQARCRRTVAGHGRRRSVRSRAPTVLPAERHRRSLPGADRVDGSRAHRQPGRHQHAGQADHGSGSEDDHAVPERRAGCQRAGRGLAERRQGGGGNPGPQQAAQGDHDQRLPTHHPQHLPLRRPDQPEQRELSDPGRRSRAPGC